VPEPGGNHAPVVTPDERAADRLRSSAQWLLASFGAVAVVIFAGLTVADLGSLTGSTPGFRLTIALVGAAASILGIVWALLLAMGLAGASTTTLYDLTRESNDKALQLARDQVAHDPMLVTWQSSEGGFARPATADSGAQLHADQVRTGAVVATQESTAGHRRQAGVSSHAPVVLKNFSKSYEGSVREFQKWERAYYLDDSLEPDRRQLNRAWTQLDGRRSIAERVLGAVAFLRLQAEFMRARNRMAIAVVIAATGAVAFGWATSSVPLDASAAPNAVPVRAVLRPGQDERTELNRQLPAGCDVAVGAVVDVIALSTVDGPDAVEVVTVPTSPCPAARLVAPAVQVTKN
jgi:hypothetical protein